MNDSFFYIAFHMVRSCFGAFKVQMICVSADALERAISDELPASPPRGCFDKYNIASFCLQSKDSLAWVLNARLLQTIGCHGTFDVASRRDLSIKIRRLIFKRICRESHFSVVVGGIKLPATL